MTAAERRRQICFPKRGVERSREPAADRMHVPTYNIYVCIVHIIIYNNNIIPTYYDIDYTRRRHRTRFFGNPYPFVVVYIILILIYIIFYVNTELTAQHTTTCCRYACIQGDTL